MDILLIKSESCTPNVQWEGGVNNSDSEIPVDVNLLYSDLTRPFPRALVIVLALFGEAFGGTFSEAVFTLKAFIEASALVESRLEYVVCFQLRRRPLACVLEI